MKTFLAFLALGGLAYFGYKALRSGGLPQGTLTRVADAPGTAVSRIRFSGGDASTLLMVAGGVVVVLLVIYLFMRR